MPTYQYVCTACGENLEAVQKFSDEPLTDCPACGGRLRKVFSPVGVVFKGSGFYKTDSRSSSAGGAAAKSTAEKGTAEKGTADKPAPEKAASEKSGKAAPSAPAAAGSSASDGSAA